MPAQRKCASLCYPSKVPVQNLNMLMVAECVFGIYAPLSWEQSSVFYFFQYDPHPCRLLFFFTLYLDVVTDIFYSNLLLYLSLSLSFPSSTCHRWPASSSHVQRSTHCMCADAWKNKRMWTPMQSYADEHIKKYKGMHTSIIWTHSDACANWVWQNGSLLHSNTLRKCKAN